MAKVTVHEIFSVTVQIDLPYPDDRRIRPRTVWFDTLDDATAAVKRAMELPFPPDTVTAMVHREHVEQCDHEEDSTLDSWPSEAHIVTGDMTAKDF